MPPFVLKVTALVKPSALLGVELALERGKIYALVGPEGAGKTTLLRTIMGLSPMGQGHMALLGETTPRGIAKARSRVGAVIEPDCFNPNLSALSNLAYVRRLRGIRDRQQPRLCLETLGLLSKARVKAKHLMLDEKQRLAIAASLLGPPELLMLDEPFSGLSAKHSRAVQALLASLAREHGCSILITSSQLSLVCPLAETFLFMDGGRIIQRLDAQALLYECSGRRLKLRAHPLDEAETLLRAQLPNAAIERDDDTLDIADMHTSPAFLRRLLEGKRIRVDALDTEGLSLDDYLTQLTGGQKHA